MLIKCLEGIQTERLHIRELQQKDAAPIYEYLSNADVASYESWQPAGLKELQESIATIGERAELAPGSWHNVAIALPDGLLIGDVGLYLLEDRKQVEIGVRVAPAFQHRGFAAEALTAILDRIFSDCEMHRASASIDPRNLRSIQLFRRLGFRAEAHHVQSVLIRGEWTDDLRFAILASEWRSRPRGRPRRPRGPPR
jgi:RimJ/RimL family protein N-acetyltransferase